MIGYYAHSHGSGHCNCANLFSKVFGNSLTIFTDRRYDFDDEQRVILLENEDTDGNEFDRSAYPEPRALHYAPVNLGKITRRNLSILENIVKNQISLLIIDVSVEIAMLARISSIPYAYVRLQGDRNDLPHLNAYEGASFLLAYYPREMECLDTPTWIVDKTVYLGFLSKYTLDETYSERPEEYGLKIRPVLLYLTGFGGSQVPNFADLHKLYDMYAIGPQRISNCGYNFEQLGVVENTRPYLEHADVIVAACGANTTAEILSLEKKFIAVPEKRQYSEQKRMAENLERNGWAVDLSQQEDLSTAISTMNALNFRLLPKILRNELKAFKSKFEFLNFDVERFVGKEKNRNETWISSTTKGKLRIDEAIGV